MSNLAPGVNPGVYIKGRAFQALSLDEPQPCRQAVRTHIIGRRVEEERTWSSRWRPRTHEQDLTGEAHDVCKHGATEPWYVSGAPKLVIQLYDSPSTTIG